MERSEDEGEFWGEQVAGTSDAVRGNPASFERIDRVNARIRRNDRSNLLGSRESGDEWELVTAGGIFGPIGTTLGALAAGVWAACKRSTVGRLPRH